MYVSVSVRPSSARRDAGRSARPCGMERGPQEVARRVAGEDAARPVAAVGRRREPDEQDPRLWVAEPRQRTAPVGLIPESRDLLARDELAPRDEPRAAAADDDLVGQGGEGRQVGHRVGAAAPPGLLEQQPVEPTRSDGQPDQAHRREIDDVDEEDRRDGTDRQRPDEVNALVQRRDLDRAS